MSITVTARPYSLISDFITIFTTINNDTKEEVENTEKISMLVKDLMEVKNAEDNNERLDDTAKEITKMICREYKTVFVSKDVLIKTLDEHGFDNIEDNDDIITAEMDVFKLKFFKDVQADNIDEMPYMLEVSADCSENEISTLVYDLNAEYTYNSQEENYIKIKERLSKHGLKIDEEEIFEDNTIVLTINLE